MSPGPGEGVLWAWEGELDCVPGGGLKARCPCEPLFIHPHPLQIESS